MTTHLRVNSDNLDLCGDWLKDNVEQEIREVQSRAPESDVEWIDWVLGHDLCDVCFEDDKLFSQIAEAEWITHVTLKSTDGDTIEIIKR